MGNSASEETKKFLHLIKDRQWESASKYFDLHNKSINVELVVPFELANHAVVEITYPIALLLSADGSDDLAALFTKCLAGNVVTCYHSMLKALEKPETAAALGLNPTAAGDKKQQQDLPFYLAPFKLLFAQAASFPFTASAASLARILLFASGAREAPLVAGSMLPRTAAAIQQSTFRNLAKNYAAINFPKTKAAFTTEVLCMAAASRPTDAKLFSEVLSNFDDSEITPDWEKSVLEFLQDKDTDGNFAEKVIARRPATTEKLECTEETEEGLK